ncbi:uracil-DNA glycosylase [Ferroplasma sp.]|uniref:uracil-DNA glycosylase n=1 Tax=Ferroplasma sp. TaxID=2591003 RepID=UPI00307E42C8
MSIEELNKEIIACRKCSRLVEYRNTRSVPEKYAIETYWNKPLTGYGDINGKLLVVGLAPAFNGGNRAGRIFTGDKSSDFLISSMYEAGFTNIPVSENINDGLKYNNMYITLALKCAPPDNIPLKCELENCNPYIEKEIDAMHKLKAILCLGKISFDSIIKYFRSRNIKTTGIKFINEKYYDIAGIRLYCSYHPSPRNVNTGLLKKEDFIALLKEIKNFIN